MKLKNGSKKIFSITEAVAEKCYERRSNMEDEAWAMARANSEFLGEITELLYNKGVLEKEELLSLLCGFKEVK